MKQNTVYSVSGMALQLALITEKKVKTSALRKDAFQCKIKDISLQNSKAV